MTYSTHPDFTPIMMRQHEKFGSYRLKKWIQVDKLNFNSLCYNPAANALLEQQNVDELNWHYISANPGAIRLIEQNSDKVVLNDLVQNPEGLHFLNKHLDQMEFGWANLCSCPHAIYLINKNQNKIHWPSLMHNTEAMHLIEQNQDKIEWESLSSNENAIHLLEANLDKIDWKLLCTNKEAKHLLEQNPDKIDWIYLCYNESEWAIDLLRRQNKEIICWRLLCGNYSQYAMRFIEENIDRLDEFAWRKLFENPNAIHIIEQNLHKLNEDYWGWKHLSINPSIFEFAYDYKAICEHNKELNEAIIKTLWHPRNFDKFCEMSEDEDE